MNNDQYLKALKAAAAYPESLTAVDTDVAAILQYVPAGGTGGAAATAAVTSATDITLLVDGAAPAGADVIGTAGVVDFATYTTIGAVADHFRAAPAWRMILRGGLRADASASKLLVRSATSCIGDNGLVLYHDTSATDHINFCISGERFVNNGLNGHIADDGRDKCVNALTAFGLNLGLTGGSPQLQLHYEKQLGTTVQAGMIFTMADDTLLEKGVDNLEQPYDIAPLGYRIVGRISVATTVDDIARFAVHGKSAFLNGTHVIMNKGY